MKDEEFDVKEMSVDNVIIKHGPLSVVVTIDGISGNDFVACCKDSLLQEIIIAAGEEYCLELFGFEPETQKN